MIELVFTDNEAESIIDYACGLDGVEVKSHAIADSGEYDTYLKVDGIEDGYFHITDFESNVPDAGLVSALVAKLPPDHRSLVLGGMGIDEFIAELGTSAGRTSLLRKFATIYEDIERSKTRYGDGPGAVLPVVPIPANPKTPIGDAFAATIEARSDRPLIAATLLGASISGTLARETFEGTGLSENPIALWAANLCEQGAAMSIARNLEVLDGDLIVRTDFLEHLASNMAAVVAESDGIAGWHKNGDIAEWRQVLGESICDYLEAHVTADACKDKAFVFKVDDDGQGETK